MREGYVGYFLCGRRVGNQPEPLGRWLVKSSRTDVGEALRDFLGGTVKEFISNESRGVEVFTDAERVEILIDGSEAVRLEMVLWDYSGVVHHCDGRAYLSPMDVHGATCGCPSRIEDRKLEAKKGKGPQPDTQISFRIAKFPGLGSFYFRSSSWGVFDAANTIKGAVAGRERETLCELSIERLELESPAGVNLAYFCPAVCMLEN
ncbi:hypothetical protein ABTY96_35895 [Streptomyces sp. NPDC096057]|uniref:recombination directionality factor n=1 Tax=Streptomyces sp. NPDC096057 TaxID=3155543 RepID=UPI0033241555